MKGPQKKEKGKARQKGDAHGARKKIEKGTE